MLPKPASINNDLNANANPFALDTAGDSSRWNDAFTSRDLPIRRVSSSSRGQQGNGASISPDITINGRFVAFDSKASNLVKNDTNGVADIFVKDVRNGTTNRVSVSSNGTQANGESLGASISRNGRYVVFESSASNLVPHDTNGKKDIFFHDNTKGTTTRLSVDTNGNQANGDSRTAYISANGRYVTFASEASNLVPNDPNGNKSDVFIRDLQTGNINRIPIPGQTNTNADLFSSNVKSISGDGRYVVFQGFSQQGGPTSTLYVYDQQTATSKQIATISRFGFTNGSISSDGRFVAFSINFPAPIGVYDQQTGNIKSISVSKNTNPGVLFDGLDISGDGRYLAFSTRDNQVVPGDSNNASDVFVYDINNQTSKRLSVNAKGIQGNGNSFKPSISADGHFVSFQSDASNLVPNDTNNTTDVFWVRNYSA
jgi:hypothetical protein